MNYAHRHLNDSQLAMIGAEFLEHETELAKQRKDAGLKQNARARNDSPTDKKGRASDKAGKKVGVSGKLVSQAAKLIEQAPELAEEVKRKWWKCVPHPILAACETFPGRWKIRQGWLRIKKRQRLPQ